MKDLLLSERWRPRTMEDIILLPRIRKIFENGITQNTILYGSYGTGKTTLSKILIGKYTKDKPFIEINGSLDTSIDVLRTKIDDFCSKVYMGLDIESDIKMDDTKYVLIAECDRLSANFQDALKEYVEEYSTKNVRFIFNTNHINKVSPGMLSRLTKVNFDYQSIAEEKFLKNELFKKIFNIIAVKEKIDIKKDVLIKIINKNFPDFRSVMNELQNIKETGDTILGSSNVNLSLRNELYSIIYDNSKNYEYIYHFVMDNFGQDNIGSMIKLFGRDFIQWSFVEKKENIDNLFKVNYIISENTRLLETNTDPVIVGLTVIGKIRDIFTS